MLHSAHPNTLDYRAIADKIEDKYIRTPHTEEDRQAIEARLSKSSVELSILNQELEDFKAGMKPKMDTEKKVVTEAIRAIRRGYEEEKVECYGIANHETGYMEWFTVDGTMVESRRLYPEERQTFLRPIN